MRTIKSYANLIELSQTAISMTEGCKCLEICSC